MIGNAIRELPRLRKLYGEGRWRKRKGFATVKLPVRKLYAVVNDPDAERNDLIRVIDESGEDYVYPADLFQKLALPAEIRRALRLAS